MSKYLQANQGKLSPKLLVAIILAVFFGIALCLRIYLPYNQVFSGDWIKFTSVDAYYHMRLIDNLVHNFPHRIGFDAYTHYPYGSLVGWPPFFSWLLAGIIWVIGLGSPSQHTIDVIGVYFPAILGALTVIPVYFIGKELFNRWAGVISAGLIAVLPGEFLGRSILGFTDHHVLETMLATVIILFLILAIKSGRQRRLSFNHIKRRDWALSTRPLVYSLLTGVFLGIFLLTWSGAPLFILIIFIYFVVQFIIDHLRGEATDYLVIVGTLSFLVASVISLPLLPPFLLSPIYLVSLPIAILMPLVLAGISRLLANRGIKPAYYPLTLAGLGVAGLALFAIISPSVLGSMLGQFRHIFTWDKAATVLEMHPLLFPGGNFSLSVAWGNFTTSSFLSLISLGILIYLIIKQGSADKTLLVVWSLVILAATFGQRRFAYYFAVNVAVLTGYLSWRILEFAGINKLISKPVETPKMKKKKAKLKKSQKGLSITTTHINIALGVIVVFFLVFYPNTGPFPHGDGPTIATAKQARFAPDDAWHSSLSWLRENTPEPFGDPDFYYDVYETPPPGESYKYPDSAYGIMSWWDYGHWITRISRRLPNATPAIWGSAAMFFSAQDEDSANKVMNELGMRYVIIDHATVTTKFHAIPTLAGMSPQDFYEVYYQSQDGRLVPVSLLYPEYYRSLVTRLYNFDGKAVTPQSSLVISYQQKVSREGKPYKVITGSQSFPDYEAAAAYVSSQKSDNYKIVSTNPFISPVPLDALEHYTLIYESENQIMKLGVGMVPEVKIFEYVK